MGGGDLNLKKSWHPMLMSNQKKVWEEEQKALEERKRIDQMMKERAEERQIQELQELQEAAGGKKRQQRVDWMYSGPASGQQGTTEEMEGYLLGKRRIDGLLKGTENQKLEKGAQQDSFMAVQNANTIRDTAAKVRDDPMLAIKKQEQAAYESMMNDPIRKRMLLKAAGQLEPKSAERDRKRRKHRHHDSDDNERRHRTHRSSRHIHDDVEEDSDGHRSRSHRSRRYRDGHSDRRDGNYHKGSRDRSDSRSRSPSRRHSRRSESPIRRSSGRESRRSRSRSRSRSPFYAKNDRRDLKKSQSWHNGPTNGYRNQTQRHNRSPSPVEQNEAAARLAAMQQDASHLDEQRQRRLREIAANERIAAGREEEERSRNAKYGGRAGFVDRFNKRAGDLSLGERLGRSGQNRRNSDD